MHPPVRAYVARAIETHGPFRNVLEFGSRDVNGGVRDLFEAPFYVGVDFVEGPGVDVVTDAADFDPIGDLVGRGDLPPSFAGFDAVVCTEVLEHAERADEIVAAAARSLRLGGVFIATMATDPRAPHSAIDENPIRHWEFYRNVSVADLGAWLRAAGLNLLDLSTETRGDLYVVAGK